MPLNAEEQEIVTRMLVAMASGIAAELGHDPDDPHVHEVIARQFGVAYEMLVIEQTERDLRAPGGTGHS